MNQSNINNEEDNNQANELCQFLSFTLGNEDYGVDILRVQEIRGWEEVREIPNTPEHIKGVMNLRNRVVPIIDLRIRFGQNQVEYNPTTVIIVLSVEWREQKMTIGIVVDAVSDVIDVKTGDIQKAPDFGAKINTRFINGMLMIEKRMIVLLDVDKLLNPDEMAQLDQLAP